MTVTLVLVGIAVIAVIQGVLAAHEIRNGIRQ